MLFDTHAHLDYDLFDDDREAMIARAREAGVDTIVTIGTNLQSAERAKTIAEKYDFVFFAVAHHPADAHTYQSSMMPHYEKLIQHPKCVAVGETGLDYYWKEAAPEQQLPLFRSFIRMACVYDKPIIIHNREANHDIISVLQEEKENGKLSNLRGIMHCFSGDAEAVKQALDLNFYISFSGNITYKKSHLPSIIPMIPHDRILIETDAPFLTPVPHRGKRNESANLRFTAEKLSEINKWTVGETESITSANARRIFGMTH
ncbi:TatD family hydrolase [bacterium]|nr:TatD family hydrolase [bacterium]NUN44257.1 TatD family hydrolase [bacterium]